MILSSLSRGAATAVRVLLALYILSFCVDVVAAAVAAPDARGVGRRSPQPQPEPRPTPHHGHHPEPSRPRGEGPPNFSSPLAPVDPSSLPGMSLPDTSTTSTSTSASVSSSTSTTATNSESTPAPVVTEGWFSRNWTVPSTVVLGQSATIAVVSPPTLYASASNLILGLTTSGDASDMDSGTTYFVGLLLPEGSIPDTDTGYFVPLPLGLSTGAADLNDSDSFFLCWASQPSSVDPYACQSYSDSFVVENPAEPAPQRRSPAMPRRGAGTPLEGHLVPRFTGTPQQVITLIQTNSLILTISTTPTSLLAIATVTAWNSTTTLIPTSTATSDAGTSKSTSSKLGIGPIVGIAVGGAAVLAIVAFLIFACLRRRRNDSEARHTLLQDDASGSRDMIHGTQAEKHASVAPAVPMLSFLETGPTSNSFDHLELSEPYSGPAGPMQRSRPSSSTLTPDPSASTAVPASQGATLAPGAIGVAASAGAGAGAALAARRSIASTIPEEESPIVPNRLSQMTAMTAPLSPRSTTRSVSAYSVPYSDNPTYGDVSRHTPQVYESPSQTPFLSEPGMSAEELSRLEEEERRIDAAIAEAEAAGRR